MNDVDATTAAGRFMAHVAGFAGSLLLTYVLTRVVIRMARKKTSDIKAALLAFLIVATMTLLITRFTMGADEGFKMYMPCLLFWLAVDIVRLKARRRDARNREGTADR
jgi:heme/copper-type cytochrome/quinol oxidase subunit 4